MKVLMWAAVLWIGVHWLYVVAMASKDAIETGKLTLYWRIILSPAWIAGVLLDFVFNYTFGWMFLAKPRRKLFSGTVQYHYSSSDGWRKRLAVFWARNLRVFDADHIRGETVI